MLGLQYDMILMVIMYDVGILLKKYWLISFGLQ